MTIRVIALQIAFALPAVFFSSPTFVRAESPAASSELVKATFEVKKMTCESCQAQIEAYLKPIAGIHELLFNLRERLLTVTYEPGKVTRAKILAALNNAGFPGTPQ